MNKQEKIKNCMKNLQENINFLSEEFWQENLSDFFAMISWKIWKLYDLEEQAEVIEEKCNIFIENPTAFNDY